MIKTDQTTNASTVVLVIVAHQDDETFGMGGTIVKHVAQGHVVYAISLTDGVSSRALTSPERVSRRAREAIAAADELGFHWLSCASFPDNGLDSVPLLSILHYIEDAVRDLSPRFVYTHSPTDLNVDHRLVYQAVMTVFRPFAGWGTPQILTFEIPSSTDFSLGRINGVFRPNYFVNVTDEMDKKLSGVRRYESELRPYPHPRSILGVRNLAKYRASHVGFDYAESFEIIREVWD